MLCVLIEVQMLDVATKTSAITIQPTAEKHSLKVVLMHAVVHLFTSLH